MLPCVLLLFALGNPPQPVYSNGDDAYCAGHRMPLPGQLWGASITPRGMLYGVNNLICSSNVSWAGCQYWPSHLAHSYVMLLDHNGYTMVATRYRREIYLHYVHSIFADEPHEILHNVHGDFMPIGQINRDVYVIRTQKTIARYHADTREVFARQPAPDAQFVTWVNGQILSC